MSQSLAAAKKRRAPNDPPQPPMRSGQQTQQSSQPIPTGLTLPQVIQVFDQRLSILEKFMRDTDQSVNIQRDVNKEIRQQIEVPSNIKDVLEDFDKRYELLAEEIVNMKNIVLSLQSFTMDVNKMLVEERIRIFSDLGEPSLQKASLLNKLETSPSTHDIEENILDQGSHFKSSLV
jgi:hypothetical protein